MLREDAGGEHAAAERGVCDSTEPHRLARRGAAAPAARILIVDDHPLMRFGLTSLLDAEPDLVVCAEAEDVSQAVWVLSNSTPDLVIADVSSSIENGLKLVRLLGTMNSHAKVLVLSVHEDMALADRAFQAGAMGFVSKSAPLDELLMVIRSLLARAEWSATGASAGTSTPSMRACVR